MFSLPDSYTAYPTPPGYSVYETAYIPRYMSNMTFLYLTYSTDTWTILVDSPCRP